MSKKMNFNDFFEKFGVYGIRNVTIAYACENDAITYSILSERYGITRNAVQHCIEYSITNCLVNYKVAILAKNKAHRNQIKHMPKNSIRTSSDRYYEELLNKRSVKEIESQLDMLRHQSETHESFVCNADIKDGYPTQATIDLRIDQLEKELLALRKLLA